MGNQSLDQLIALRERLQARKTKAGQRFAELEKQVEAVTVTINLLKRGEEPEESNAGVAARELQDMTQLQAIIYIAQHNDNRVRIVDAKKLLTKAGIMKLTKNSYGVLYTVITRSGRFKRCGPGEYELLPEAVLMLRKPAAS